MKKIGITQWYRKSITCAFMLAILFLSVGGNASAADYVSLKIYPEHVGVFTEDGFQQFLAFGVKADGSVDNLTKQVDWTSSDEHKVTIDINGLASIRENTTSGQVKITCSYPKTSTVTDVLPFTSILLAQKQLTLGGTVSGLASGNEVVLLNNGDNPLKVSANTAFQFSLPVEEGDKYKVTVRDQPTRPNQICTVANGTGTMTDDGVSNVKVTCKTNKYTIGGTVSGLASGNSVVLKNSNGNLRTVSSNGGFTFSTAMNDGSSYNVTVKSQPATPSQTCTVAKGSGTLLGANITNVKVTCTTNDYSIGGSVSGLASGNSVILKNNGGDNETVSANGNFTFNTKLADQSSYSVTVSTQPSGPNQVCTVTNGSGTLAGSNVTNVNVSCDTTTYTVSGTVIGLATNNIVTLLLNSSDAQAVTHPNDAFSFTPIDDGTSYTVTVQGGETTGTGVDQDCVVTSGATGTLNGADVSGVEVTCTTRKYTVSGTVTGLADTNFLTLFLNGGDMQTVTYPADSFSFTPIDDGTVYSVTVSTQPDQPDQVCTVQSPAMPGTINGANVSNVVVNCVTTQYTVGGTVTGLATDNTVKLTINGGDEQTVTDPATAFTFPARDDGTQFTIAVSQQPDTPSQTCNVTSTNPDTINGGNVTNVTVNCTTDKFSIGGSVSGLNPTNTGLTLQLVGVENLLIGEGANGNYIFPTDLDDQTAYEVVVLFNPINPPQTCTIPGGNASGTLAGQLVDDIDIVCVDD